MITKIKQKLNLNEESLFVSAAIFLVSIVNMATSIILGHLLLPGDFGTYTYILSIFTLISVAGFFAQSYVAMNFDDIYTYVYHQRKKIWKSYMVLLIVFFAFIFFLGIDKELSFGYFANISAFLFSFLTAFLIPPGRYKYYFVSVLIFALVRITLTYITVLFGLGVSGPLIALFMGYFFGGVYALYNFYKIPHDPLIQKMPSLHWKGFGYAGILVILVTVLSAVDIFFARFILSQYDFGMYSGVVTIAKLILFIGTPFYTLLLNDISRTKKLTYENIKTIILFFMAILTGFFLVNIFKGLFIKLFLGQSFVSVDLVILPISLFVLGNTIATLVFYISIALKKIRELTWFLIGFVIFIFITISKIEPGDTLIDLSRMYGILGVLITTYSVITLIFLCKIRKKT